MYWCIMPEFSKIHDTLAWRQLGIRIFVWVCLNANLKTKDAKLGPVVQSVVSLTSSLRVISLTVLADSIYNFLKFFAEKM